MPATPDGTIAVIGPFGTVTYLSIESIPGFDPSVADAGGPYTGGDAIREGDTLTLAGSATAATNTSIIAASWDLDGDGVFGDVSGLAPVVSWQELVALGLGDDGAYEITLSVTDSAGNVATDTVALEILNTAPAVTVDGSAAAVVGVPYVLSFDAADPGDDTVARWEIDWGDGSAREVFASDASSASHVYLTTGVFNPVVVATDEDGTGSFAGDPASTPWTAAGPAITVTPPTPVLTTVGTAAPLEIREGEGVTLRALVAGTPTGFTWDLDDDGVFGDETLFGTAGGTDLTLDAADLAALGLDDGDALYRVAVEVSYGAGALGVDAAVGAADLLVRNAAPSAVLVSSTDASGPVNEGEPAEVTFVGATDPSAADAAAGFTYSFDFDNDGVFEIVGSTDATATVPGALLADAGTRTVRGVVTDKDGGTFETFAGVRVAEVAPTLLVTGADTASEGAVYTLDLDATDPGDDTVSRWTVDWGDGSRTVATTASVSLQHVFADDGLLRITVTAQDEDGLYDAEKLVTVANVAPDLTVSGPAAIDEGDGFVLTLGASDPGDDTVASWHIDWGDGTSDSVPGSTATVFHLYTDDSAGGTFRIVATATDEDGTYEASTDVEVANVAPRTALGGVGTTPVLLAGGPPVAAPTVSVNEGASFVLQIAAPVDPGDDEVSEYRIDWGDGSVIQTVAAPAAGAGGFVPGLDVSHVYADGDALHTVAVTLVDEDGSFANATTLDVDVRNVVPSIGLTGDSSVDEGDVYTLTLAQPSDPGDDTVLTLVVDWGDGEVESFATPGPVTHVYRNVSGSVDHAISVGLVDEDGTWMDVATKTVRVDEVPPVLEISGAAAAVEGTPYTLTLGSLVDPGSDTGTVPVLEYVVDWGDGTVDSYTAAGEVEHRFVDGAFDNRVSVDVVTAAGTLVDAASLTVQVANAAPELTALDVGVAALPDLNGDSVVDIFDASIVASSFGGVPASNPLIAAADLNGDGAVDFDDLNIIMAAYGQSGPAVEPGGGPVAAGGTAIVEGRIADLGVADTHEVLVDWGDGTTTVASVQQGNGEASFFARHTYAQAGVYKVAATVADSGGDTDVAETAALVTGAAVHDGVLHIVGTGDDDTITVTRNLSDPARERVDVSASFLGGTMTFDVDGLAGAVVFAGDGADTVTVEEDVTLPFLIAGGRGNDVLRAGGGDDVLLGNEGEDVLEGGGGSDLLIGGAGEDEVDGGADDDTVFFDGDASAYTVTPGAGGTTTVTAIAPSTGGEDEVDQVEEILFEDSDPVAPPAAANPWAEDVIARLVGPAEDVDETDAYWLLFD
jgi:hypothetical protein